MKHCYFPSVQNLTIGTDVLIVLTLYNILELAPSAIETNDRFTTGLMDLLTTGKKPN